MIFYTYIYFIIFVSRHIYSVNICVGPKSLSEDGRTGLTKFMCRFGPEGFFGGADFGRAGIVTPRFENVLFRAEIGVELGLRAFLGVLKLLLFL